MSKKRNIKIDWNACPHCGEKLKNISGFMRCESCQYNAPNYPTQNLFLDDRPREGIGSHRIVPMLF